MPANAESRIVLLISAVWFANILDFMMVMPLGPDFARALTISTAHLGYIGGSYTASAAIAGLLGSLVLDRFDRRKALAACLAGLVLSTALGGLAQGFTSLLATRVLAGAFGGPAAAVGLAIISDIIPAERRGKALGKVMGAFSIAAVLGVPIGLQLSEWGGWRMPFFAVAGLGMVIATGGIFWLPSLTGHLASREAGDTLARRARHMLAPGPLMAAGYTGLTTLTNFMIVPNLASQLQFNLGYPRAWLGLLYMAGGAVTFFSLRLAGRMIDRFGAATVSAIGSVVFIPTLFAIFIDGDALLGPWRAAVSDDIRLPVVLMFTCFLLGNSTRNVAMQTLSSKLPAPAERAGFLSILSAVQHLCSAAGAMLASTMLVDLPGPRLGGTGAMATVSILLSLGVVPLMWLVERRHSRSRTPDPSRAAIDDVLALPSEAGP